MKGLDLLGKQFGRLTVVSLGESYVVPCNGKHHARFVCICECGREVLVARGSLVSGATRSCGCLNSEIRKSRMTVHGHRPHGGRSPEHHSWSAMLTRCRNSNATGYERYGGRGIKVCERWNDFTAFLADMGPRPEGMTLDRIDVNGNYEPCNCRWATRKAQCNNTRRSRMVTWLGETRSVTEWAEYLSLPKRSLWSWLHKAGWDLDKALTNNP